MSRQIKDISLADLLPESIREDETIKAAAEALDTEIQAVNSILNAPALLPRLEELPERVVDYLAWQFSVDFWDPDAPLQRKRSLVRRSISWHRYKGTLWAVQEVANTMFGPSRVTEWFDWGGAPYLFRVDVDLQDRGIGQDDYNKAYRAVMATKNTRSHLDRLRIILSNQTKTPRLGAISLYGETTTLYPFQIQDLEQMSSIPRLGLGMQSVQTTTVMPQ